MSTHQNMARVTAQSGAPWRVASTRLPTKWGMFEMIGFERAAWTAGRTAETALALLLGDPSHGVPLLRVHSQCLAGELFGSLRCDCSGQFDLAMQAIAQEGRGLVIYQYQEGRGIGVMAKLQAYELRDAGIDTIEANHALKFKADCRDFNLAVAILHDLRIPRVRHLTNNPRKVRALSAPAASRSSSGFPARSGATMHSLPYLQTKKQKMGHELNLGSSDPGWGGGFAPAGEIAYPPSR